MGVFALVISNENKRYSVFSKKKGFPKAEVIMAAQEWLRNYKDDFKDSLDIDFVDTDDDSEE
ncbi:MAG: hypothetical protein AABX51_04145 [Nanoarchaeota archaeon]